MVGGYRASGKRKEIPVHASRDGRCKEGGEEEGTSPTPKEALR